MVKNNDWDLPESIWDMRRKAPFHFLAKADNARMSAYVLSHVSDDLVDKFASDAPYGGDHRFATGEGFRREASIAMELILKAILCVKTKDTPPATHDVYNLWTEAKLPKLSHDDAHRLAQMTQLLYWAGRYAAPRRDKDLIRSQERFDKHKRTQSLGKLKVRKHIPLGWEEFDSLYQIAAQHFWDLKPNDPENHVS